MPLSALLDPLLGRADANNKELGLVSLRFKRAEHVRGIDSRQLSVERKCLCVRKIVLADKPKAGTDGSSDLGSLEFDSDITANTLYRSEGDTLSAMAVIQPLDAATATSTRNIPLARTRRRQCVGVVFVAANRRNRSKRQVGQVYADTGIGHTGIGRPGILPQAVVAVCGIEEERIAEEGVRN